MLTGISSSVYLYVHFEWWVFLSYLIFYIYLLPPLLFQLLFRTCFPKFKGDLSKLKQKSFANTPTFAVWWISSQLQVHFIRFQFLEECIKWIPGVYSFWLRLWGAKIGKNILWTPRVLIVDRPFLEIGDNVIIGTDSRITSHLAVAVPDERRALLFLAKVKIGDGATLGACGGIFPGGEIKPGEVIEALGIVRTHKFSGEKSL